jgi:hypothetical protein
MRSYPLSSNLSYHLKATKHVAFADQYFDGRYGHNYLYQKPFFHPRDCAPSVTNLGQRTFNVIENDFVLEDV